MAQIIALFWYFSIFSVVILSEKQTTAKFLKNYLSISNKISNSKSNTNFGFSNKNHFEIMNRKKKKKSKTYENFHDDVDEKKLQNS